MAKLQCQRIGCNAFFTEDDNPDDSCTFHESGPLFHDGMKEWSCCKRRSHDFSLFLEIPGCKTGKHTKEKPVLAKPTPPKNPISTQIPQNGASNKDSCPRCRQGFFCSDHGSQVGSTNSKASAPAAITSSQSDSNLVEVHQPPPVKKIVGINEPQVCKNKGCGKTFKEKDNHDSACSYHPGPAVFHDRMRGWKCCDIHVKEFDEFMEIEPCAKGWHNGSPTS